MKFALFSDLHADSYGLDLLISHIEFQSADRRICLGDTINAQDPAGSEAFFERVASISDAVVLGNHEAVLIGACDLSVFAIKWQEDIQARKTRLASEPDNQFIKKLAKLPPTIQIGSAIATHGSFNQINRWKHIRYTEDLRQEAEHLKAQVNFLGHGHIPFVAWLEEGSWYYNRQLYYGSQKLSPGRRYIINVGSVLGSRELRAYEKTFLVYDDSVSSVTFYNLAQV